MMREKHHNFFFFGIPKGCVEKDLCKVFLKLGIVWEIFKNVRSRKRVGFDENQECEVEY